MQAGSLQSTGRHNIQIAFVPCVSGSFEKRFLPFEPIFGVLFKVGLVAFLDTILKLFLDAFRFSHDILLNKNEYAIPCTNFGVNWIF